MQTPNGHPFFPSTYFSPVPPDITTKLIASKSGAATASGNLSHLPSCLCAHLVYSSSNGAFQSLRLQDSDHL
jgi:hypothetical protein